MAEEFVKLEVPEGTEETGGIMNSSDYAQVIFHDIAESYPVKGNIVCNYTVTPLLQASNRDWVCLCSLFVYQYKFDLLNTLILNQKLLRLN